MRKNSNDMKHCGVYLIRLKKKKIPYTLDLGLTNCPPLNLTFALQPYVNSLSEANLPMFQLVQFVPPLNLTFALQPYVFLFARIFQSKSVKFQKRQKNQSRKIIFFAFKRAR